jgi:transposase
VRRAARVTLTEEESARLGEWVEDKSLSARIRQRARILLSASRGQSNRDIAREIGVDVQTVSLWRRRFEGMGLEAALREAPRSGRRTPQGAAINERILYATFNVPPPKGARWTTRTLGRYLGVNHMAVHRVWRAGGVVLGAPSNESALRSSGTAVGSDSFDRGDRPAPGSPSPAGPFDPTERPRPTRKSRP